MKHICIVPMEDIAEKIKSTQLEIQELETTAAERRLALRSYRKEYVLQNTDLLEKCVEIIKKRPSLFRGWRSSDPCSRLVVVHYLFGIAKKRGINIFELLDGIYSFVKEDSEDVPRLDDREAIDEYLRNYVYSADDEEKIRKFPVDIQVLLIAKKAYEVPLEYGSFEAFRKSVVRDQCRFSPN